jgi:hypothetical protein
MQPAFAFQVFNLCKPIVSRACALVLFVFFALDGNAQSKLFSDNPNAIKNVTACKLVAAGNIAFTKLDSRKADSLYEEALAVLQNATDLNDIVALLRSYALNKVGKASTKIAKVYLEASDNLSNEDRSLANVCYAGALYPSSPDSVRKLLESAIYFSNLCNNDKIKAIALNEYGNAMPILQNRITAFRSLLDANRLAMQLGDTKLKLETSSSLINFYNIISYTEKAKQQIQEYQQLVSKNLPMLDSAYVMKALGLKSGNAFDANNIDDALSSFNKIVEYGLRINNQQIVDAEFIKLRSYCQDKANYKLLQEQYEKYPQLLSHLSDQDSVSYLRTMAGFAELEGNVKKAEELQLQCINMALQANRGDIISSRACNRISEFYVRIKNNSAAIKYALMQKDFAMRANYLPDIVSATERLATLYGQTNNVALAYQASTQRNLYKDSLLNSIKQDEVLRLQIEGETTLREIAEQKAAHEMEVQHNLQYSLIAIAMLIAALILLVFSRLKVPLWLIRAGGYLFFIFMFESIILVIDAKLHHLFHGAPLPIIIIKIVLISGLLPLHHWVEHKVVHFLQRNRVEKQHQVQEDTILREVQIVEEFDDQDYAMKNVELI